MDNRALIYSVWFFFKAYTEIHVEITKLLAKRLAVGIKTSVIEFSM